MGLFFGTSFLITLLRMVGKNKGGKNNIIYIQCFLMVNLPLPRMERMKFERKIHPKITYAEKLIHKLLSMVQKSQTNNQLGCKRNLVNHVPTSTGAGFLPSTVSTATELGFLTNLLCRTSLSNHRHPKSLPVQQQLRRTWQRS